MWTFTCSKWDLVPGSGIEPGSPALGVRSLSHWTTREVPNVCFYCLYLCVHHSVCDFSHLWQDSQGVRQSILRSWLRFVTTKLTLEEKVVESKTWYFITHRNFFSQENRYWPVSKWYNCSSYIIILCPEVELLCNKETQFLHIIWVRRTWHTRSCIPFSSRTKAFRVPTANT